jgi:hypothetical protein
MRAWGRVWLVELGFFQGLGEVAEKGVVPLCFGEEVRDRVLLCLRLYDPFRGVLERFACKLRLALRGFVVPFFQVSLCCSEVSVGTLLVFDPCFLGPNGGQSRSEPEFALPFSAISPIFPIPR